MFSEKKYKKRLHRDRPFILNGNELAGHKTSTSKINNGELMERIPNTLFRVDNYDNSGTHYFEGIFADFTEAESTLDFTNEIDGRPVKGKPHGVLTEFTTFREVDEDILLDNEWALKEYWEDGMVLEEFYYE